jgi:ABC-type spermidine/putrescine transport system permease subunit I
MIKISKYIAPFVGMQIFFLFIPILALFYTHYDYSAWNTIFAWSLENNFFKILFYTIKTSIIASCLTLFIGYMVAYCISQQKASVRVILLILFFIPSITNFLIQLSSIMNLFYYNESSILSPLSFLISKNNTIIYSDTLVYIGYIYCYLPYMLIPIYNSLTKFNTNLMQASFDLGASFYQSVTKILIPATSDAIKTGFCLVFVSASGEFIINEILGGDKKLQIGSLISHAILNGSMTKYSVVMILLFIISIILMLFLLNLLFKLIIVYFKKM